MTSSWTVVCWRTGRYLAMTATNTIEGPFWWWPVRKTRLVPPSSPEQRRCGWVVVVSRVATAAKVATAVAVAMPEAMVTSIDVSDDGPFAELLAAADAVVIGPGLQDMNQTCRALGMALEHALDDAVIVVDAIAIAALPTVVTPAARRHRIVITPNHEELRSLTDEQGETRQLARSVAERFGVTVVSFGHVASPDGRGWIDTGAATGLGTSGAGDVLAGAVGGAGARCHDVAQAACWAALCHRRAAARLAETFAPIGYLARQLADELPLALAELSRNSSS